MDKAFSLSVQFSRFGTVMPLLPEHHILLPLYQMQDNLLSAKLQMEFQQFILHPPGLNFQFSEGLL
ncbi:MAG: hypothetical protein AN490_02475 [Anabaena sp. AL09]|nr:MAG: hypothetical protein AN490_02475 [Anabaena sp. AL09]